MEQFIWETPEELDQKLAQRVRKIRKRRSITQEKLASISGVSYGSIKRFETTGCSPCEIIMEPRSSTSGTMETKNTIR